MNSVYILVFSALWLIVAYFWYGKRTLQRKLVEPLDQNPCPSHAMEDGLDFSPANRMVLFGHHFSSIAGAGPIVGPIVAVTFFGWGPAVIWLLVAGVFIGAIHDYLSLIISVRHCGVSIPDTAKEFVSNKARILFLVFVWLTIILVIAVFGNLAAKSLITKAELVIPTFMAMLLAIVFGIFNKKEILPLWANTIFAISGLIFFIWLGFQYPITLPYDPQTSYIVWFTILMIYGFVASVTPVWILLQPRDYISSWVLIIGVLLSFIGIFIVHPDMNAPLFTGFVSPEQGPMIPFLFIIIACGAVSGFHSLIASGTSSKQINKESDALFIGFGAMLVETIIGIVAVIIAGGAIMWGSEPGQLQELFKNSGALAIYGDGFGKLTSFIFTPEVGSVIGVTIINIFIMTTLDTTVRLARFLTNEMIGGYLPRPMKNKFFYTIIPIIPAFVLGITDSWSLIWPVFGAANQLVAALVFIILTSYLYAKGKPVKYTLWATVFMLVMTITALFWLAWKFFFETPNFFLGSVSAVLIVLALMMAVEGIKKISSAKSGIPHKK